MEAQVAAGALPGALTLIWRGRQVAHHSMVGSYRSWRAAPEMRDDALFRLYSMTKPVTAVALLMLLEEGRIALDDAVIQIHSRFRPG